MDSRKALFAILAGAVLTTAVGMILTPYKDSYKRKKTSDKLNGKVGEVKDVIGETFNDVKGQIKKMNKDIDRMVNEGGK